ncbi:MAG TPA: DUF1080 domain-containing protein [Planctomycetota bacterium]|jgi:hypothetical protein
MRSLTLCAMIALLVCAGVRAADADGWVTILDEKSFKEWKLMPAKATAKVEEADGVKKFDKGQWTFKDGVLKGEGEVSHIFSPRGDYENFQFKCEAKISDKGNSGQYFRAALGNGWPKGYEAQINSTHSDPKRTGSLYNFMNVREMLVPPDTWFTQEVIAEGNHIIIKVNDKVAVDFVDEKNTFMKGHMAFQQHNLGSIVEIKNVQVKEIKK